ncbi:hypothetical protein GCM10010349_73440 [Streptomyces flavofungini]|nr:hypothetical protein GCM10010349_73440 [Streptomyces flavofungini]
MPCELSFQAESLEPCACESGADGECYGLRGHRQVSREGGAGRGRWTMCSGRTLGRFP